MHPLENPRHERMAQALSNGLSANKAYVHAGYAEHRSNAAALAREEHIKARVAAILAERERMAAEATKGAVEALAITREEVLRTIWNNGKAAEAKGQHGPANRAYELFGKAAHGMFVDRLELGKPGEFEQFSDRELVDEIKTLIRAIGGANDMNDADVMTFADMLANKLH